MSNDDFQVDLFCVRQRLIAGPSKAAREGGASGEKGSAPLLSKMEMWGMPAAIAQQMRDEIRFSPAGEAILGFRSSKTKAMCSGTLPSPRDVCFTPRRVMPSRP
jgi:hypothetical protein